jgi:hypothetical protein
VGDHGKFTGRKDLLQAVAPRVSKRAAIMCCDISLYEASILRCFNLFFDEPGKYCFLALLPSYLERPVSSLVYMMEM